MIKKWLVSWVGESDHKASETDQSDGDGPIANALLSSTHYDRVFLLTNYPHQRSVEYCSWLEKYTKYSEIDLQDVELSSPTNYAEIYQAVSKVLTSLKLPNEKVELTFHLSPGTPAMVAIWIMLAKTRFPATLIQSSRKNKSGKPKYEIETVDFKFDLASDFLPEFLQRSAARIERLASTPAIAVPEFSKIVHTSQVMQHQIDLARRIAVHNVPVLILGETGTGKELFAEAIAKASLRKDKPFIAVNCGAISKELINSELFGHKKGSFTGADADRKGHFREASGGTLFLDEIGDLPLNAQVRLLRAIQQKEITPLGETKPVKVDVRIIAATHRDLISEVANGTFREDLFHRLAVGILNLPPLRDRTEDISLLVDYCLDQINEDSKDQPEWQNKKISQNAKNIILIQPWPGNVRELYHALLRAAIWSRQEEISESDIRNSLLSIPQKTDNILGQSIEKGFDLEGLLNKVESHYIQEAMYKAHGKKKLAAEILGFTHYQTLSNRIAKLGLTIEENNE